MSHRQRARRFPYQRYSAGPAASAIQSFCRSVGPRRTARISLRVKRSELQTALRAAGRVARQSEFILIGSQAVHAHCLRPPAEVLFSQECDLYPRTHPQAANLLDTELGRNSAFARQHGFYVDVVTPDLATLPEGWEKRLKPFRAGLITAFCLEVHDLLASKLAAGRLKDLELAGALLKLRLGKTSVLRRRLAALPLASDRQKTRLRLKVVLEALD